MKLRVRPLFYYQRCHAYAALAMVAVIGVTALLGLMFAFRLTMRSHEAQVRNQIKVDYRQKEDAILRALVAIVPNRAIGAMQSGSAGDSSGVNGTSRYGWEDILATAIIEANAGQALNSAVVSSFGISGIINANTGDNATLAPSDIVSVIAGGGTLVGPGNISNTGLLADSVVGGKLPPALSFSGSYSTDQNFPIISKGKTYPAATPGLGADALKYPLYNLIPYPNIRFGLAAQGQNFIAKRNWWAFSLTFGNGVSLTNNTGTASSAMPTVKKNYVLSIYEVPSQLALSAGAKLQLGTYQNGGNWVKTTITGRTFGSEVVTGGSLSVAGISSRRKINIGGTTTVGGVSISNAFDALGTRETRWKTLGSDYYGASNAGDSGRVAILPLSQGDLFIRRASSNVAGALSPTPWDEYALGAKQCAMQIEITQMSTKSNRPKQVVFHYYAGGVLVSRTYNRGSIDASGNWDGNWVNYKNDAGEGGVENIPFYTQKLKLNAPSIIKSNPALTIKLERIPAFLASLGADGLDVNHSISIWSNPTDATVSLPGIPSRIDPTKPLERDDMAVVIRDGNDMRAFTTGFSIVTDHRVYIADNINQIAMTAPVGSGLPGGVIYYPPVSIYAAEKRFGTNASALKELHVDGQLTSLQDDDGSTVNPLDFKGGINSGGVTKSAVTTNLSQILSPAQLPPVNKMTWLVTIEEVHP